MQVFSVRLEMLFMLIQFTSMAYAIYFQGVKTQIRTILAMSFLGIDYILLLLPLMLLPKLLLGEKKFNPSFLSFSFWCFLAFYFYAILLSIPAQAPDFK